MILSILDFRHPVAIGRCQGRKEVSAVDRSAHRTQQPGCVEARADLSPTQFVTERGARHLDATIGKQPDRLTAVPGESPRLDPMTIRRQGRLKRGLILGLSCDKNPSDAVGDTRRLRRGLAPNGQEDLCSRACPRPKVTRRFDPKVVAQTQMRGITGLLQRWKREVTTAEGRRDDQYMDVVAGSINVAGRRPGDTRSRQAQSAQRALDDHEPGLTIQPGLLGQRQGQVDYIFCMPSRAGELLEVRERRRHAAPRQCATQNLGVEQAAMDKPGMREIIQHRPRPVMKGQHRTHQRSSRFRIRLIRRSALRAAARIGRIS